MSVSDPGFGLVRTGEARGARREGGREAEARARTATTTRVLAHLGRMHRWATTRAGEGAQIPRAVEGGDCLFRAAPEVGAPPPPAARPKVGVG